MVKLPEGREADRCCWVVGSFVSQHFQCYSSGKVNEIGQMAMMVEDSVKV